MAAAQEVIPREERRQALAPAEPQGETGTILSLIERVARDNTIDIDRMERLMTMHREQRAEEAARLYMAAMSAAQAEMPRVVRDAKNSHTNSRYARLETITKAITPVYTRHGFSLSFDSGEAAQSGQVRIVCTVSHAAGHERQHHLDLSPDTAGAQGKANKTAIQGLGSTVSYGRRYLTLMIFNIALTNEDNDGNSGGPERVSDDQAMELRELAESVGVVGRELPRFLAAMDAESLADIPATRFNEAVRRLNRFGETRNG